jgi:hypothetical protein
MSQSTPDRTVYPYRVPILHDSVHVRNWCNEQIGREYQQWCCGTSSSVWAKTDYYFRDKSHWELFLRHWD